MRIARAVPAALVAAFAVLLVSQGELAFWLTRGDASEPGPIFRGALLLAGGAGLLALVLGTFAPRFVAVFVPMACALPVFASTAMRLLGIGGTSGIAGAVVLGVVAAGAVAWVGRLRPAPAALGAAALASLALVGGKDAAPDLPPVTRPDLPDVVLLVLDTTRRDRLEVYGYDRPTSPQLVELAARAEVYEDAWSVAPWTPPSHASMLTGLLPAEHGVDGQGTSPPLPEALETLPEVLAAAGYRTAGFPANAILTAPGWSAPFQEFRGANFAGKHSLIPWLNRIDRGWTEAERDDRRTVHLFERTRTWWVAHDDRPRFVFLNLMDAHRKYHPTDEDFARFLPGVDRVEAERIDAEFWERFDAKRYQHDFSEHELDVLNRLYDAEIAGMDREIGRFTDWLEARGDLEDTILVITSDHGERLGERGVIGHKLSQDPYLLRVPLIVRWPAKLPAARIVRRVQLDGLPGYVLHLAGVEAPPVMARNSLHQQDRELVVAQLRHPKGVMEDLAKHIADLDPSPYDGDWFFVADREGFSLELPVREAPEPGRLTDTVRDPNFTRDVSAEHPERAARLRAAANALPRFGAAIDVEPTPEMLENLRALGYIR
ncbi:MAG: sulfatase [Candidatus Eiseniibacteriota bacterium]